jgi:Rps23 Pro-64 3,4-dihydroxylase Tpa1-like proline 4-hydroxylase
MNLLIGFLYGLVAQVLTFLQLQGSIKYGWYEKYPIIIILASIPSGWLFLKSVQHFVIAFGGEIWPSRLIGYGIGVVIFTLMSYYLFKEPKIKSAKPPVIILMHGFGSNEKDLFSFANQCIDKYNIPVKLLYFKRLMDVINDNNIDLGKIKVVPLMSYPDYLSTVYHSFFIISDSGTGQEEPSLLDTKVIVPRDYTERPQSYTSNCSIKFEMNTDPSMLFEWIDNKIRPDASWLGNGNTSKLITSHIQDYFFSELLHINSNKYKETLPFPYAYQDNFLDLQFATNLQEEILSIKSEEWDRYENPFEQKNTLRDKFSFPPLLMKLFKHFESESFVQKLSDICDVSLILDTTRNFWGVHTYKNGDKLDIHLDAERHPTIGYKKKITLGLYLSANWKEEYGCELEIWKGDQKSIQEKIRCIAPIFNRLVLFTCNDVSWHGNPEPCISPSDSTRIFVTISYLSDETSLSNRVKALFVKRPQDPDDEEKDLLRMLRADPEKYKNVYKV